MYSTSHVYLPAGLKFNFVDLLIWYTRLNEGLDQHQKFIFSVCYISNIELYILHI